MDESDDAYDSSDDAFDSSNDKDWVFSWLRIKPGLLLCSENCEKRRLCKSKEHFSHL